MHDEFRLVLDTTATAAVLDALSTIRLEDDAHRDLPRLALTHSEEQIFLYGDTLAGIQAAKQVIERTLAAHDLTAPATITRWHPLEERWEDASVALPTGEQQRAAEHERLEQAETEESLHAGHAEWEVRVTLASHHDARQLAERLRGEGIPVNQQWRHLLVGANNEDQAAELARRLRAEAPAGSEIVAQGNGLEYWEMLHPYAYLGGIAN